MKLYDTISQVGARLPTRRKIPPSDLRRDDDTVVVDIQNVSDWFYKVNPKEVWDAGEDFPHLESPWPFVFFEYTQPEWINSEGREVKVAREERHRVGAYMWQRRDGSGVLESEAMLFMQPLENSDGLPPTLMGSCKFMRASSGELLPQPPHMLPLTFKVWADSEQLRDDLKNAVLVSLHPVYMAITFCHAKNVTTRDHHIPEKVAAKRRKAGKPVGVSYKTLVIDGMKEILRTEGQIEKTGLKKALHICRGHFATYTEDAPLFGKVTGTFWKPMHVRGSKKHGEVKKDYKVVANGDNPNTA